MKKKIIIGGATVLVVVLLFVYLANQSKKANQHLVVGLQHLTHGDTAEAIECFKWASDHGNADAMAFLGMAYANGVGKVMDVRKARKLLESSARRGSGFGQGYLGMMYIEGNGVVELDVKKAIPLLKKSAGQGNQVGQAWLGAMYATGNGIQKDVEQGVSLLMRSAHQGNADGQAFLAGMYVQGIGVRKDHEEAIRLFELAAAQGQKLAIDMLAKLPRNRRVVTHPVTTTQSMPTYQSQQPRQSQQICPRCGGSGRFHSQGGDYSPAGVHCEQCQGRGYIVSGQNPYGY